MLKILIVTCSLIGLSLAAPANGSGSEEDDQNLGKTIDDTTKQVGTLLNALYASSPQDSSSQDIAKKLSTLVFIMDSLDGAITHAVPSFSGKLNGTNTKKLDKLYRLIQKLTEMIIDNEEKEEEARKIAKEAARQIGEEYHRKRKEEEQKKKDRERERKIKESYSMWGR